MRTRGFTRNSFTRGLYFEATVPERFEPCTGAKEPAEAGTGGRKRSDSGYRLRDGIHPQHCLWVFPPRGRRGHIRRDDGKSACPRIDLKVAQAENLPFSDDRFNVIHVARVLHHLFEMEAPFREIYRCLKPGGIFYADESPNAYCLRIPSLSRYLRCCTFTFPQGSSRIGPGGRCILRG